MLIVLTSHSSFFSLLSNPPALHFSSIVMQPQLLPILTLIYFFIDQPPQLLLFLIIRKSTQETYSTPDPSWCVVCTYTLNHPQYHYPQPGLDTVINRQSLIS